LKRFVKLVKDILPQAQITSSITDVYVNKVNSIQLTITKEYIDKYVGNSIAPEKIVNILSSLEFEVIQIQNQFKVKVPTFRVTKDITSKVDLVEEITRIYGYNNIIPNSLSISLEPVTPNPEREIEEKLKNTLVDKFDYHEVHSYVWYNSRFNQNLGIKDQGIGILNPSAQDMHNLREYMTPVLLEFIKNNMNQYQKIPIFEIGSVFIKSEEAEYQEYNNLCLITASEDSDEDELFYNLKGIATYLGQVLKNIELEYSEVEKVSEYAWIHPQKAVAIKYQDQNLGYITVIHPEICQKINSNLKISALELNLDLFNKIKTKAIKYEKPSPYPEVSLDFSFVMSDSTKFETINQDIQKFEHELLNKYQFIDIYQGSGLDEGKKSLTFNFRIGSNKKTLTKAEIDQFSDQFIKYMEKKGYYLR
jgi:phenylalanyl-tRNA synthetase beta chain